MKEAVPGKSIQLNPRSRRAGGGRIGDGEPPRRGGGSRSAQRRGAGHGQPAGLRPQHVRRPHYARRTGRRSSSNPDNPLLNRAIQAQLAPGSTFKPIVALAGLEAGVDRRRVSRPLLRRRQLLRPLLQDATQGRSRRCRPATGPSSQSCDVFFYTPATGSASTRSRIMRTWRASEARPASTCRRKPKALLPSTQVEDSHFPPEVVSRAKPFRSPSGRAALTVTPLQLAAAIGGIADGGSLDETPHLVKAGARGDLQGRHQDRRTSPRSSTACTRVVNQGGTGRVGGTRASRSAGRPARPSWPQTKLLKGTSSGAGPEGQRLVCRLRAARSRRRSWSRRCLRAGEHGDRARPHRARRHQGLFRQEGTAPRRAARRTAAAGPPGPAADRQTRRRSVVIDNGTQPLRSAISTWPLILTAGHLRAWASYRSTAPHRRRRSGATPGGSSSSGWAWDSILLWGTTRIDYHTLLGQVARSTTP